MSGSPATAGTLPTHPVLAAAEPRAPCRISADARPRERGRLLEAREREQPADAYELLGIAPEASAAEVKKRYWRLSLLIHPDKCGHARANDAFQAVSAAAKALQARGPAVTLPYLMLRRAPLPGRGGAGAPGGAGYQLPGSRPSCRSPRGLVQCAPAEHLNTLSRSGCCRGC